MHQIDTPPKKVRASVNPATNKRILAGLAGALLTFFGVALTRSAAATEAELPHYRVELVVTKGMPACDRRDDFDAVLDLALGQPLVTPPISRVLTVRIGRTPSKVYGVDLDFADLEGHVLDTIHREFPASTCCYEVLFRSALAAAYRMENPKGRGEEPQPAPPPPAPPPAPKAVATCPEVHRPAAPLPQPAPPAAPPLVAGRRFLGLGGVFALGAAPEIVGGVQFAAGYRFWPRWFLELDARATLPIDARPAGPTIVRVYSVASAAFAGCYQPGWFGFCGLVTAGRSWARTLNLVYPREDSMSFLGAGLRGVVERPIRGRWTVRIDAEVTRPFVMSTIRNEPDFKWWRTWDVMAQFGASVFASF